MLQSGLNLQRPLCDWLLLNRRYYQRFRPGAPTTIKLNPCSLLLIYAYFDCLCKAAISASRHLQSIQFFIECLLQKESKILLCQGEP